MSMLFWAKVKSLLPLCALVVFFGCIGTGVMVHLSPVLNQGDEPLETPARQTHTTPQPGRVWAWGNNQFGQLGDGTTTDRASPVPVAGLDDVIAISAGGIHILALRRDHTVWAWGANISGQLGDGTTTDRLAPVPVRLPDGKPLANIASVAAGARHSVALTTDGRMWAWGGNANGQLGDGTTTNRSAPVQVVGIANVTAIAAGEDHTVALKANQTVWAWGSNPLGERGDGTTVTRLAPIQVKTAGGAPFAGVVAIAAGRYFTVALKDDHTVWTCGYGIFGQLGRGVSYASHFEPVSGLSGAMSIAAGRFFTLALKDDRTAWMWGRYTLAHPRDGLAPVTLSDGAPLANVTAIAAGAYHAAALTEGGGVWTWGGQNDFGELGDGAPFGRSIPAQVRMLDGTPLAHVTAIAAGGQHTVVVIAER